MKAKEIREFETNKLYWLKVTTVLVVILSTLFIAWSIYARYAGTPWWEGTIGGESTSATDDRFTGLQLKNSTDSETLEIGEGAFGSTIESSYYAGNLSEPLFEIRTNKNTIIAAARETKLTPLFTLSGSVDAFRVLNQKSIVYARRDTKTNTIQILGIEDTELFEIATLSATHVVTDIFFNTPSQKLYVTFVNEDNTAAIAFVRGGELVPIYTLRDQPFGLRLLAATKESISVQLEDGTCGEIDFKTKEKTEVACSDILQNNGGDVLAFDNPVLYYSNVLTKEFKKIEPMPFIQHANKIGSTIEYLADEDQDGTLTVGSYELDSEENIQEALPIQTEGYSFDWYYITQEFIYGLDDVSSEMYAHPRLAGIQEKLEKDTQQPDEEEDSEDELVEIKTLWSPLTLTNESLIIFSIEPIEITATYSE